MVVKNLLVLSCLVCVCFADVYMHNPRGSNDRNCERNVNRNNGNRLFDSQNNAKGGYACPRAVGGPAVVTPKMFYHAGSVLPVEWTNQHGCGNNPKLHCNIVLQYACENTLDPAGTYRSGNNVGTPRDGIPRDSADAATDRIQTEQASGIANTVETRRFGMHETPEYYADCSTRQRNKGLFTADQRVRRRDARGTRQNPNGNRRGLECPEERDYYPYWHPTPWMDVAVITSSYSTNKRSYYQTNSQNTANKGTCTVNTANAAAVTAADQAKRRREFFNNQASCEASGNTWTMTGRFNQPAPEVVQGQFTRVNQLGNSGGPVASGSSNAALPQTPINLNSNRYMWTIPNTPNQNCVLRIRYNISTYDYDSYAPNQALSTFDGTPGVNNSFNYRNSNGQPTGKSPVTQDPYVDIGPNADQDFLSLAVNTNQYGRTFQDRSYVFEIKPPVANIGNAKVYNLNVRGKRGNIVQTYPAVEYDFTPNDLRIKQNDLVHFQWTGSDYNPRRGCNDAEGGPPDPNTVDGAKRNPRADRSNIVETTLAGMNYPRDIVNLAAGETMFTNANGGVNTGLVNKLAFLDQVSILQAQGKRCLTRAELNAIKNKNQREFHPQNCAKLNAATTPYFNAGPQTMRAAGKFTYFSSRNNNFSNRDQTGYICVGTTAACNGVTQGAGGKLASAFQLADDIPAAVAADQFLMADSTGLDPPENDATGDGIMIGCANTSSNPVIAFLQSLSGGQVAGLAIGTAFAGALIAGLVAFVIVRRNSASSKVPTGDNWQNKH